MDTRKRVLVVEDSELVCTMLRQILKEPEYNLTVANTCEDAAFLFRRLHPQIVVCDINMAFSFKGNFLQELLNNRDCPVILSSNAFQNDLMIRAIKQGVTEFITKPFVFTSVNRILSKY